MTDGDADADFTYLDKVSQTEYDAVKFTAEMKIKRNKINKFMGDAIKLLSSGLYPNVTEKDLPNVIKQIPDDAVDIIDLSRNLLFLNLYITLRGGSHEEDYDKFIHAEQYNQNVAL